MNVTTWADRQRERFGDFDALVDRDPSGAAHIHTSFGVHDAAARFASALIAADVAPGERVVLWLSAGELVAAFTGTLRAGAVAVIVSDNAPLPELTRIVRHAGARTLVTTAARAAQHPLAALARVIVDPEAFAAAHVPLTAAVARAPEDLAQIVYTSGATGEPKGVAWTHGLVAARYAPFADERPPDAPARRSLCALPLAAAFGAQYLYLRLLQKMTLVLLDRFEPAEVLQTLAAHRIEATWLVPSMCEALLRASSEGRSYDLSSLASVLVGGSAVSPSLVQRMRRQLGVRITTVYGLTELGPVAQSAPGEVSGSAGKPRAGLELRIVDERGEPLPTGEIGAIQVRAGAMSATYYMSAPASDAEGDAWFDTGDLGSADAAGALTIAGRKKELIIQGGVNVYPRQLEAAIGALADVVDCGVIGVPDPYLGEAVVACVVRSAGSPLTAATVIAACRAEVDPRRRPARVVFVDAIPRNELGKVKTADLRSAVEARRAAVVESDFVRGLRAAPTGARRALLFDALGADLADLLGTGALAPNVPLGQHGLDSLGVVAFADAIAERLGRPLSPTLAFDHPTLAALADHLLAALALAPAPAPAPAPTPTPAPPPAPPPAPAPARSPIAIIGIGCRVPGADTPDAFWAALREGHIAAAEITRWDVARLYDPTPGTPGRTYVRKAALLDAPDALDAALFGLGEREARRLDPQHGLTLEVGWLALEDAGYDPLGVGRSGASPISTGVFLGISGSDPKAEPIGSQPSMAAGRLARFLDLDGPVIALDTSCSSSLVAVHAAISALRLGECDLALAGGVSVIGSLESFVALSQLRALSPDGRSKSFDAAADGYGRGEGAVMLVLRRLDDALADRDRVIAVIRGSAVNHDGRSTSLTAPNGPAQSAVIRAALANAGLAPDDIDLLEAHGTGTPIGDPIELQAALAVYGNDRVRPLIVGSVKANLGHLEAAAGATSLAKVALALSHQEVPPQPGFGLPSPMLGPAADRVMIARAPIPWTHRDRRAGVTSIGMNGTNAHVVLEASPAPRLEPRSTSGPRLYPLAARTPAALRARAAADARRVAALDLDDACFTAGVGRAHLAERAAIVARSPDHLAAELAAFAALAAVDPSDTPTAPTARSVGRADRRPKIAFLYTGQGAQRVGMGRALFQREPVFRAALLACAEVLDRRLPRPLLDVLFGDAATAIAPSIDASMLAQPTLFALEWSLTELWRSWGITPDLVLGHSFGEIVAASVAGYFSLEDGLLFAAERGRLTSERMIPGGAMANVALDAGHVAARIAGMDIEIAGYNAPDSTVVSGTATAIDALVAAFIAEGLSARRLHVEGGFHSRLIDPVLDPLSEAAARISFTTPRFELISTATGARADSAALADPGHWRRALRAPVRYHQALLAARAAGMDTFVEIGPDPVLLSLGQRIAPDPTIAWLPSLRRDRDEPTQMLESLAGLYTRGATPRWSALFAGAAPRRVALPTYPFERRSYRRPSAPSHAPSPAPSPAPAPARLITDLEAAVRAALARTLPDAPSPAADDNLLDRGLDSLRMLDLLADLRRATGIACTPNDVVSLPTIAGFTAALRARAPASSTTSESSPLVAIRAAHGDRPPVFCVHPSGGEITAYLRLRELFGSDQPLYAIRSRALAGSPEHPSLRAMAADYAALIRAIAPPPYRLFGWSLGGLLAHAVAEALEPDDIELVGMVDVPERETFSLDPTTMVLFALAHDASPSPASRVLERILSRPEPIPELAWCEDNDILPPGQLTPEAYARVLALHREHARIVREHEPGCVHAPLALYWADATPERTPGLWPARTTGSCTERHIGGTHYTIMRPPLIESIARDFLTRLRPAPGAQRSDRSPPAAPRSS